MNKILRIVLYAGLIFLQAGCGWGQNTQIKVKAFVHDPDGKPVEGVTVRLILPRYREGDRNQRETADTNRSGIAVVSGIAQQDYFVGAGKPGYYYTKGARRIIMTEKGYQKYAVGTQEMDIELRPIKNPVVGISNYIDRLIFPAFGEPLGFDLERGDWVSPYGQGIVSDFIFTMGGYFNGINDYDQILELSFSNERDGLIMLKYPKDYGPEFMYPYEAPIDGYVAERIFRRSFDGTSRESNVDMKGETHYIFRVRTELDDEGNIIRAMYGVVASEISFGGNNEIGRGISFKYSLNPDWSRNIEFDIEKTVKSWNDSFFGKK